MSDIGFLISEFLIEYTIVLLGLTGAIYFYNRYGKKTDKGKTSFKNILKKYRLICLIFVIIDITLGYIF